MGDHVEAEGERPQGSVGGRAETRLDETIARLRIVPIEQRDELEPRLIEVPGNDMPAIALPDFDHMRGAGEEMGRGEGARVRRQMVEMTCGRGLRRGTDRPMKGRHVGESIGPRLVERVGDIHARVAGATGDGADGRSQPHSLRPFVSGDEGRLGE